MKNFLKKITGIAAKEQALAAEAARIKAEAEEERNRLEEQELALEQARVEAEVKTTEEQRREVLQKEKEEATSAGEPWVAVLDTQINPDNIKNGFFELDWNNQFIEELLDAGYSGETNEQIVDSWFRTIAMQILGEEGLDTAREMGYINVVPISKGKSEVS